MQQLYRKLDLEYVLLAGKEGKKKGRGGKQRGGNGSVYISRAHQLSGRYIKKLSKYILRKCHAFQKACVKQNAARQLVMMYKPCKGSHYFI